MFQNTCVQATEHPLSTGLPNQPTSNFFNAAIVPRDLTKREQLPVSCV